MTIESGGFTCTVLMMVKYVVQIDNASKKKETIPFIGMYKGKINSTFRT